MMKCWNELPENRPSFTELCSELETLLQVNKNYLDLTNIEETHEYMTLDSGSDDEPTNQLGIENIRMSFMHKSFVKEASF